VPKKAKKSCIYIMIKNSTDRPTDQNNPALQTIKAFFGSPNVGINNGNGKFKSKELEIN